MGSRLLPLCIVVGATLADTAGAHHLALWLVLGTRSNSPQILAVAVVTIPLLLLGVWACDVTGRDLGVQDHGCMVIDEIVAYGFADDAAKAPAAV